MAWTTTTALTTIDEAAAALRVDVSVIDELIRDRELGIRGDLEHLPVHGVSMLDPPFRGEPIVDLRRVPRYWRAEDAAGSRATTVDVILALARSGRLRSRTFGSDPVLRFVVQDVSALSDEDFRRGEKLVAEYAAADEEARRIPVRSWLLGEEATVAFAERFGGGVTPDLIDEFARALSVAGSPPAAAREPGLADPGTTTQLSQGRRVRKTERND